MLGDTHFYTSQLFSKFQLKTKQKLSNKMKGRYEGANNPFYGKSHAENAKILISKANKGS